MKTIENLPFVLFAAIMLLLGPGCLDNDNDDGGVTLEANPVPQGTLVFEANGEDFAQDGFTSKDKWEISFDHVYVSISNPTAFQVVENLGEEGIASLVER